MLNGHPELCCVDEGLAVEVEVDVVVEAEFSSTTKSFVKNLSNMGNGCIWRIAERGKRGQNRERDDKFKRGSATKEMK